MLLNTKQIKLPLRDAVMVAKVIDKKHGCDQCVTREAKMPDTLQKPL